MTLLSMNQITTYRWSLEEDIENYQEAGYSGIGVWRQKLSDYDEDYAIGLLAASGLNVTHLSWAGGFTGSDGRTLAEGVDEVFHAVRVAAALQAGCLVIYTGGRNNHTFRHAGRLLRMALDKVLPFAEECGVALAIEPVHSSCARDWTFLTDAIEVEALIDEYGSRFLKIACDLYHFPGKGLCFDALKRLAPQIGIVHLCDRRRSPSIDQERFCLGDGHLPLEKIIDTLRVGGYTGSFDVKLMGAEVEAFDYWALLERSQQSFSGLASVAMHRSLV